MGERGQIQKWAEVEKEDEEVGGDKKGQAKLNREMPYTNGEAERVRRRDRETPQQERQEQGEMVQTPRARTHEDH